MIAKILVNRLKSFISKLISKEEGAFVPSHSILENTLITQELAHDLESGGFSDVYVVAKLDMERAYDEMSINLLMHLLITLVLLLFGGYMRVW